MKGKVRSPAGRVRLLAALALLGALPIYLHLEKRVTLVVDGEERSVRTLNNSVGALLVGEGIEVGPYDRVIPVIDSRLGDGMRVEVQRAKEISLVLNGSPRTVHVIGKTVEDVLRQINVRAGRHAYIRPSRGAPIEDGDVVEFRRAVSIRLAVDGEERRVITNAQDVGYLLDSLGVILGRHDVVAPALDSPISGELSVEVTRVEYSRVVEPESIGFQTVVRYTDDLIKGERRVEREGTFGLEEVAYRVRLEDGKEASRELLGRRLVREPASRVVLVGTRDPNVQFGTASWYHRTGMVAAHRTLPKGTRVRVTHVSSGRTVTVVIDDRGPFVSDFVIDLSDDAFAKLAPLSSGILGVRLEW